MKPLEFIKAYGIALETQDWKVVEPLISAAASVTFSDGSVHLGKANVQRAFENNFKKIKSEKYSIENIKWLIREEEYAVYLFEFNWSGIINGKSVSGNGIGTSVIVKDNGKWKLLTEHLGKKHTPNK